MSSIAQFSCCTNNWSFEIIAETTTCAYKIRLKIWKQEINIPTYLFIIICFEIGIIDESNWIKIILGKVGYVLEKFGELFENVMFIKLNKFVIFTIFVFIFFEIFLLCFQLFKSSDDRMF